MSQPTRPASWTSDALLADGTVVQLRPARPDDIEGVAGLFHHLSPRSRYRRFLSPVPADGPLPHLADLGTDHHLAFVAETASGIVGVVECFPYGPAGTAEVAFAVDEDHQHLGLGTTLFEHMTAFARARGIHHIVASTVADNTSMRAVFADAGLHERTHVQSGVLDVELDLDDAPLPNAPVAEAAIAPPRGTRRALAAVRALLVVSGGPLLGVAAVAASGAIAASALVRGDAPPWFAAAGLVAGGAYGAVVVPWTRRWGTVPAERAVRLPGDDHVPKAGLQMTRAVTVDAPPERVWDWLAQIGCDRGGFYSHAWLENLAGCRLRNADRVHPEWQHTRVGEVVMLHPLNGLPITRLDRPWSFAMGGWYFALEARPGGRTRLLARTRVPRGLASLGYAAFVEFPHFVMERRMLLGIQARAAAPGAAPTAGA